MSHALTALSPLDGRYASKTRALQEHFSEFALIRHRVRVEIAWLKALAAEPAFVLLPAFSPATVAELDRVAAGFSVSDAERVKSIGLKDKSRVFNTARIEALEVENLIEAAQATMVSAAARRECRGAHTVNDYERPADDAVAPLGRDDANWMKHTLWHSASNSLSYKPVNLKPLTVDSVPPKVRTF